MVVGSVASPHAIINDIASDQTTMLLHVVLVIIMVLIQQLSSNAESNYQYLSKRFTYV